MSVLPSEKRKMLRAFLKEYDQKMWHLVSYAKESEILKYDPDYATTNDDIMQLGWNTLAKLKGQVTENELEIANFAKAIRLGEINLREIVSHQPRRIVRWHLNNARHEVLHEMRKDWSNVRITIVYLHPDE